MCVDLYEVPTLGCGKARKYKHKYDRFNKNKTRKNKKYKKDKYKKPYKRKFYNYANNKQKIQKAFKKGK